jgi:adenine-specific DNA-methyltransferase
MLYIGCRLKLGGNTQMAWLNFRGKTFVQNHHLSVKYHQLIPKKAKSLAKKVSLNDNLIIHGDNLKALKALLPTYAGKIDRIYIDPPYNTGNQKWVYNDNVNSPITQEWLGKVVDLEDLTRHDKWLCMMMPRFKLLKELLSEEGIIFISIDDNEVHHLRALLDEIFSESNYLAQFTWRGMHTVRNSSKDFNKNTEFVLVFAKNKRELIKEGDPNTYLRYPSDKQSGYSFDDDDGKGRYKLDPLHSRNFYTPYEYVFSNGVKWKAPEGTYPRYSTKSLKDMEANGIIAFPNDKLRRVIGKVFVFKGKKPLAKRYLKDVQEGVPPDTLIPVQFAGFSKDGTAELMAIFGTKVFDQPKPKSLIEYLLRIKRKIDNNSIIILDSFAGSGTTAHAVLDLNKEDGGNRKFILVECEDYADSITAERMRRVIKGIPKAKDEKLKEGLGGTFSYFELGDPIEMDNILEGDKLPSYEDLARYIFYTATGEEFDSTKIDEKKNIAGESKDYLVYLFYKPEIEYLKSTAFNLDRAIALGSFKGKRRLVFAPSKYLDLNDPELIERYGLKGIEYCQLPFEIYKLKE